MFCPNCGAEERQPTQFCRSCGADMRVVRSALQSSPALIATETARLEIARAVASKIAALDPRDHGLVAKIAAIRMEAEKVLETSEERFRKHLTIALASVGGGALFVGTVLLKSAQSFDRDTAGLKAFMAFSFFLTVGALLVTHFLPKRPADGPRNVELPPAPAQTTTNLAIHDERLFSPPSVTEMTTQHLSREASPAARSVERNTQ